MLTSVIKALCLLWPYLAAAAVPEVLLDGSTTAETVDFFAPTTTTAHLIASPAAAQAEALVAGARGSPVTGGNSVSQNVAVLSGPYPTTDLTAQQLYGIAADPYQGVLPDNSTVYAAGMELGNLRRGSLETLPSGGKHWQQQQPAVIRRRSGSGGVDGGGGAGGGMSIYRPAASLLSSATPQSFATTSELFIASGATSTSTGAVRGNTSGSVLCLELVYIGGPNPYPTAAQTCGGASVGSPLNRRLHDPSIDKNINDVGASVSWSQAFCSATNVKLCTDGVPASQLSAVTAAVKRSMAAVFRALFPPQAPDGQPASCSNNAQAGYNAIAWVLTLKDQTGLLQYSCADGSTAPKPKPTPDIGGVRPCASPGMAVPFQLRDSVSIATGSTAQWSFVNDRVPCFDLNATATSTGTSTGAGNGCDISRVAGLVILANDAVKDSLKAAVLRTGLGDVTVRPPKFPDRCWVVPPPAGSLLRPLEISRTTLPSDFPGGWTPANLIALANAKDRKGRVCLDIALDKLDDLCAAASCAVSLTFTGGCCTDWKFVAAQSAAPAALNPASTT